MKKKLEAELISIAHRILKLKNKSELVQLHQEVQNLYEKLSVLRFLEEQFEEMKPTIGRAEVEAKLETAFEERSESVEIPSEPLRLTENEFAPIAVFMPEEPTEDRGFEDEEIDVTDVKNKEEGPGPHTPEIEREPAPEVETPHVPEIGQEQENEPEPEPETEPEPEEHEEPDTEDEILIKHVLHMDEPEEEDENEAETQSVAEEPVKEEVKAAPKEISFADLLGHDFSEPVFERVEDIKSTTVEAPVFEKNPVDFTAEPVVPAEIFEDEPYFKADVPKVDPLHDAHHKAITFGLNDKIGFEKHLFGGSSEDMNRVVSQLGSFDTFEEAKEFIDDMVKPDYNNWVGKEDYELRFMEIIEKKFN